MKYFSILCSVLFLTCAFLQMNDPDSLIWVVFYALASIAAFVRYRGLKSIALILYLIVFALGVFVWLQNDLSLIGSINNEGVREGWGIAIVFFVLLLIESLIDMQVN